MTLYYEHEAATIAAIRKHGPVVALLSVSEMMLCDRSLKDEGAADLPDDTPMPEGFDEITFEVKDEELAGREVYPKDMPSGRYFIFTAEELEEVKA
jgi:hypothetical protein